MSEKKSLAYFAVDQRNWIDPIQKLHRVDLSGGLTFDSQAPARCGFVPDLSWAKISQTITGSGHTVFCDGCAVAPGETEGVS